MCLSRLVLWRDDEPCVCLDWFGGGMMNPVFVSIGLVEG